MSEYYFCREKNGLARLSKYGNKDVNIMKNTDPISVTYNGYAISTFHLADEIQNNPFLVRFIIQPNNKVYYIVKIYGYYMTCFEFLREETVEKSLSAVMKDGMNLRFVTLQTPEICQAAILNNPESEQFVNIPFTFTVSLDVLLELISKIH